MARYSICGIDCGPCRFQAEQGCRGRRESEGKIFWGGCDLYQCCSRDKKLKHCGKCPPFPCEILKERASSECPERIDNLRGLL